MSDTPSSPLIPVAELLDALGDPRVRIADVRWFLGEPGRGQREFDEGHIPGAVFVDLDRDLAAPPGDGRHPLPDPLAFADRMGELGFGDEHTVVILDADRGQYAARMWLMLDRLGHRAARVLEGGIEAWRAAGGSLTTERTTHLRATMTLAGSWPDTIDREQLGAHAGEFDLVDVRAAERYRGEVEPMERVAGHIPNARSLPYGSLLADDGRMRPADELRPLIRGEGGRAELPLVVSCGSGVTACFGALAARVAGLRDPLLYPGSYSDWVGAGLPVASGPDLEGPLRSE